MGKLFGAGGFGIDPGIMSTVENDYWEEFNRVNDAFVHEPEVVIRKVKKPSRIHPAPGNTNQNGAVNFNSGDQEINELSNRGPTKVYPHLNKSENGGVSSSDLENNFVTESEDHVELRSVAVQTDGNYDEEPELPYKCCFCFRTSTPCVVWIFVVISIVFFKMGAIVTGRWIYLSSSSFDEVVFYIAFTVCLGFSTIYFRRGTKYHNPFDLLFLMLTIPMMWALLTFTTTFLKKDIFFYVGSGIYSTFVVPYTFLGTYISYRFWKQGKLFLRRVEGDTKLEPYCRKLFFTQSLIMFDAQLTICASIISMAPTVNHSSIAVWISLIVAPWSIGCAILALIVGYFAIRRENRRLTGFFTILSGNQFILVLSMLLKRPTTAGVYYTFINAALSFSMTALMICHIGLLAMVWIWIVPAYGKGLKGPVSRTSQNNCIQCATLTMCR